MYFLVRFFPVLACTYLVDHILENLALKTGGDRLSHVVCWGYGEDSPMHGIGAQRSKAAKFGLCDT